MMQFKKKYQVWQIADGNQFSFEEFDTLDECIAAQKYGAWYITKQVILSVSEAGSTPVPPAFTVPKNNTAVPIPPLVDESDGLPPGYATGPIGKIG